MNNIKWFIRVMTTRDENIINAVNINYFGKVFDLRTSMYFKNFVVEAIRKTMYTLIDADITFTKCWKASEKRSVKKFFEKTGLVKIQPSLEEDSLKLEYINSQVINAIVDEVLKFQRDIVAQTTQFGHLRKFFELPEESEGKTKLYAIVAPYFAVNSVKEDWYEVNLDLLRTSIKRKEPEEKLYAAIAIHRNILGDSSAIRKIIDDYSLGHIDGYAIWIVEFDEIENASHIKEFKNFIYKLSELKKPILNLYGGYYSLLLSKLGVLEGIVTKICYKQKRIPCQSGGPARENYYFLPIKNKISPQLAGSIIHRNTSYLCDCPVCNKFMKGYGILDMSTEDLKKHFLYAFKNEVNNVMMHSLKTLLHQLKENTEEFASLLDVEYMNEWYDSLINSA